MIYVDTSAFIKLIKPEEGSTATAAYIGDREDLVSSKVLAVEARRGVLRAAPGRLPVVDLLLARLELIDVSDAVIESASRLPDPTLRSLDAIHLATALLIREDVEVLLSDDDRLIAAAASHGITTAHPG